MENSKEQEIPDLRNRGIEILPIKVRKDETVGMLNSKIAEYTIIRSGIKDKFMVEKILKDLKAIRDWILFGEVNTARFPQSSSGTITGNGAKMSGNGTSPKNTTTG